MGHRLMRTAVAATVLLGATASSWPAPSVAQAEPRAASDAPAWPITDPDRWDRRRCSVACPRPARDTPGRR